MARAPNTFLMMRRTQLIREAIDARYATSPRDFLAALRAGSFGVWKERSDPRSIDAHVRQVRRGKRIEDLTA